MIKQITRIKNQENQECLMAYFYKLTNTHSTNRTLQTRNDTQNIYLNKTSIKNIESELGILVCEMFFFT